MRRATAHRPVELPRRGSEALGRIHRTHIRSRVRLAGFEHDLAGMEQFSGLQIAAAVLETFGEHGVIAAPRDVHAVQLSVPLVEPPLADEHERHRLVRRPTSPVLDDEPTPAPLAAHGIQLARPSSIEREYLIDVFGDRQRDRQRVE